MIIKLNINVKYRNRIFGAGLKIFLCVPGIAVKWAAALACRCWSWSALLT